MNRKGIGIKLISLSCLVLIPILLLSFLGIKDNYKQRVEAELQSSQEFAEILSMSFINYLDIIWYEQYAMGLAIYLNPSWTTEDIYEYLFKILDKNQEVFNHSWVGLDGTILVSTSRELIGESIVKSEYFNRLIKGEQKVISNLSVNNNQLIIPLARNIIVDNKTIGIVVSQINVDRMNKNFSMNRLCKTSSYGLVDKNGLIVFKSGNEYLPLEKRLLNNDSPIWDALEGQIKIKQSYSASIDGSDRMGVNYPIYQIGWACFVTTSVDELLRETRDDIERDIALLLIIAIGSILGTMYISRRFIYSISNIKNAAEAVTKGEYNYKLDESGYDELATTSHAFNLMSAQIESKISKAEEYNKLKSQFFSTISHELRTPLNVILSSTQLMQEFDKSNLIVYYGKTQKYLKIIKQNSFRLLRLINNLIDLNKAEVCHLSISPKNLDIVSVVEDITLSIVEYTKQKHIMLIFDTDIEEKIISFDPDMIERIILNLLSNAIKYTNEGGTIEVNIHDLKEAVTISIKDTGIGIPEDMQEEIFNCFTQVDSSLRRNVEGSGIGLSLVKSVIELHGGSINVISELGYGSEFILELPNIVCDNKEVPCEGSVCNVERIQIEFSDIYLTKDFKR